MLLAHVQRACSARTTPQQRTGSVPAPLFSSYFQSRLHLNQSYLVSPLHLTRCSLAAAITTSSRVATATQDRFPLPCHT